MFAQNNKISYQAVVRDAQNRLVANKTVTVTVNIYNGTETTAAYTETQTATTNLNGLVSLQIGPDGDNAAWSNIQWKNASIKTMVTLDGTSLGTLEMPLTAVPYALYADFADSVNPNVIANYLASHNIPDGAEVNVQSDWKQTNPQADDYIKNKPDLTQYATKDALNDTAAAIREDFPTVPTDVSAFNNDIGYLTSYTESQVLSISHDTIFLTGGSFVKLPAGFSGNYHDLVDTPTKVSSFVNDAGYIKSYTETDPTVKDSLVIITVNGNINEPAGSFTLNQNANDTINIVETDPTVPDWAKTESKPTYDYSEITNTPNIKDTIGTYLTNNHYINQTTLDSKHYLTSDSTVIKNLQSNVTNLLADTAKYATKKALKDTATVLRGLIDNKADASSVYTKTESDARYLQSYTETDPTVKNSLVNIKVNNELAGSFTLNQSSEANINITETDPTVPDWAKTNSKPTYNYSEIANTPNIKDTLSGYLDTCTVIANMKTDITKLQNGIRKDALCDSVSGCVGGNADLSNYYTKDDIDGKFNDTTKYATKKALNDTAAVLRGLISTGSTSSATLNTDNSNALTTNSSETISGEVKLHKISKTGSYADLNNRPSIKDSIGDFLYDNKYINNADCETVNLCTLAEQLATLRTDMRKSIDSLKHTIDSLEGVIDLLSSDIPPTPIVPEGAIDGRFTINGDGAKVYFSQGNLQATYDGSAWSWAFADNQYDYIGNAEGNTKVTDSSPFVSGYSGSSTTVDLFGWVGASSNWNTNTGVNMYGITSSTATANKDGYGNQRDDVLKSDWGTLAITNGGNATNSGWRTLTSAEWEWILGPSSSPNPGTNCRTSSTVGGTENARYAKATVAGMTGLIIFPDSYTHPNDVTAPTSINTATAAFTVNTYDATAWEKMEEAGAVFLPVAGYRYGTSVNYVGSRGGYWTSSPYNNSTVINSTDNKKAYYLRIYSSNNNNFVDLSNNDRCNGYSVRLVKGANN